MSRDILAAPRLNFQHSSSRPDRFRGLFVCVFEKDAEEVVGALRAGEIIRSSIVTPAVTAGIYTASLLLHSTCVGVEMLSSSRGGDAAVPLVASRARSCHLAFDGTERHLSAHACRWNCAFRNG